MLLSRTKFTKDEINFLYDEKVDKWLGYEEALKYGIATDLISYIN